MEKSIFNAEMLRRGVLLRNSYIPYFVTLLCLSLCLSVSVANIFSQTETPPTPASPKAGTIPRVQEKKLANGLTVAVVEKRTLPIVTIQLLIKSGASAEDARKAGLADITASMLTKGTKTRSATQIAEEIEFLGGSINSGAGWNNSFVTLSVTSDKLDQAVAIMADVVLNPAFDQKELDLLKSQTLDGLTYNLKQPGFLASYVASRYSFDEHPDGGTPASLSEIGRTDIADFHRENFVPANAILILAGDITNVNAIALANKFFGKWRALVGKKNLNTHKEVGEYSDKYTIAGDSTYVAASAKNDIRPRINKFLVIDLPNSGQAAVTYVRKVDTGRNGERLGYYPALVLNSVLGGGYSARLNQEIRIKRGLSYGANSAFAWRKDASNFAARTQTKNESAAQVAELILQEVARLSAEDVSEDEMTPRKSVLTGNFGRDLETTGGLVNKIAELYSFDISPAELSSYVYSVNNIQPKEITGFAIQNLDSGDMIIVGDYDKFKDDLAKRFPTTKIDIIKAADLDLSKDNLRK